MFKVGGTTSEETSITMPSDINIIRMEATNKNFAQIKFVDNNNEEVSVVTNPNNENPLPRKELYVNGVIDNTSYDFKYTSSSPHVASIDDKGNVTLHGIAGSIVTSMTSMPLSRQIVSSHPMRL